MTEEESLDQPREIQRLLFERGERLKELAAINQTTDILKEGKPLDETLQQLAKLFPSAWQSPNTPFAVYPSEARSTGLRAIYRPVGYRGSRLM